MAEMDDQEQQEARCTELLFPPSRLNELEREALDQRKLILLITLNETLLNYKKGQVDYWKGVHYVRFSKYGDVVRYTVRLRPGARWFLRTMKEKYNIYLVTNSSWEFALCMQDLLEGGEKLFEDQIFCGKNLLKDDLIKDFFSPDTPLVVKLDHREDCWSQDSNLLMVLSYDIFDRLPATAATPLGVKYGTSRYPRVIAEDQKKDIFCEAYMQDMLTNHYDDILQEDTYLEYFTELDKMDEPDSSTPESGSQGLAEPLQIQQVSSTDGSVDLTAEEPVPGSQQGSSSVHGSASAAKASKGESTLNPQVTEYPGHMDWQWMFYQGGWPTEFYDPDPGIWWEASFLHTVHRVFFSVYDHYGKSKCTSTSAVFDFISKWEDKGEEEPCMSD